MRHPILQRRSIRRRAPHRNSERIRRIVIVLFFLVVALSAHAQVGAGTKGDKLMKEIERITNTTDWTNEAAAKKAGEQIRILSERYEKEMTQGSKHPPNPPGGPPGGPPGAAGGGQSGPDDLHLEDTLGTMDKLLEKYGGAQSEYVDMFLAAPMQQDIKSSFKEEQVRTPKSKEFLDEQQVLTVDVALPDAKDFIAQMGNYRGIRTLIITSSKPGHAADVANILSRAANYPLKALYVINLKSAFTTVPDRVGSFPGLEMLALYNNAIVVLPESIGKLAMLQHLYVDVNPLAKLPKSIGNLTHLAELGLVKTVVASSEITRVKALLPSCKVFTP